MSKTVRELPIATATVSGDFFHVSGADLLDKRITIDDINTAVRDTLKGGLTADENIVIETGGLLKARSNEDVIQEIGRTKIWGASDVSYFSHFDKATSANFALSQNAAGSTYINAGTGQTVNIQNNAGTIISVSASAITMKQPLTVSAIKNDGILYLNTTLDGTATTADSFVAINRQVNTTSDANGLSIYKGDYTSTRNTFLKGTGSSYLNANNGNVLIGTTTDSGYKLDVDGTLRATGALTCSALTIPDIATFESSAITFEPPLTIYGANGLSNGNTTLSNSDGNGGLVIVHDKDTIEQAKLRSYAVSGVQLELLAGGFTASGVSTINTDLAIDENSVTITDTLGGPRGSGSMLYLNASASTPGESTIAFKNSDIASGNRWFVGINQAIGFGIGYGESFVGTGTLMNFYKDTSNVSIGTTTDSGYKLDVNGTARVTGATTLGSTLTVSGITTFNGAVNISQDVLLDSSLSVTGTATLGGLTVGENTDITVSIGRGQLGYDGLASDVFTISHYDNMNETDFGVKLTTSNTLINVKSEGSVFIRSNDTNIATFNSTSVSVYEDLLIYSSGGTSSGYIKTSASVGNGAALSLYDASDSRQAIIRSYSIDGYQVELEAGGLSIYGIASFDSENDYIRLKKEVGVADGVPTGIHDMYIRNDAGRGDGEYNLHITDYNAGSRGSGAMIYLNAANESSEGEASIKFSNVAETGEYYIGLNQAVGGFAIAYGSEFEGTGTIAKFTASGRVLFGTTTDNETDEVQVAGSIYASGGMNISGTTTFNGAVNIEAGLYFDDSEHLYFGTGNDADFYCNGSHMYTNLGSGIGNWYIQDGGTTRFTFDDNGLFTATGNITSGGNIIVGDDLYITDRVYPTESPTKGIWTITGGTNFTIPRGNYHIRFNSYGSLHVSIEMLCSDGNWYEYATSSNAEQQQTYGVFVSSSGSDFRINPSAESSDTTVYYNQV